MRKSGIIKRIVSVIAVVSIILVGIPMDAYASDTSIVLDGRKVTGIKLTNSMRELSSGVYIVDEDLTMNAGGEAGIIIKEDADVTIYVKEGCTLKAMGRNAYQWILRTDLVESLVMSNETAGNGILVPARSTLRIRGAGTVIAQGGDGTVAEEGYRPSGLGGYVTSKRNNEASYVIPKGGSGGRGSNAPGAGIGGSAAFGGLGGDGGSSQKVVVKAGEVFSSESGGQGETGQDGLGMGNVYIMDKVKVTAKAGKVKMDKAAGGVDDGLESLAKTYAYEMGDLYTFVGLGGSGGGGGLAANSANIGGGGAGGGGGGGGAGGSGSLAYTNGSVKPYYVEAKLGAKTKDSGVGGVGGEAAYLVDTNGKEQGKGVAGEGAGTGTGGAGGKLYLSEQATLTEPVGNGAAKGDGKAATVIKLQDIAVNVKLDGETTSDWVNEREVVLYQNDRQVGALERSENGIYRLQTVLSGNYLVYIDGENTGKMISKTTSSVDVDFYSTDVSLKLDDSPWKGEEVTLRQNGYTEYELTFNEETNKYEGISLSGKAKDQYEVYVGDEGSGEIFDISAAGKKSTEMNYYTAEVTLQYKSISQSQNSLWGDQKVVLIDKSGVEQGLEEISRGVYQIKMRQNAEAASYEVYVNNIATDKMLEISSNGERKCTLPFYQAQVDVRKNGVAWSGAVLVMKQNGKTKEVMTYADGAYWGNAVYDNGKSYDIEVQGVDSESNTGLQVNAGSRKHSLDFYEVNYVADAGSGDIYQKQIVQKGKVTYPPAQPYANGKTFEQWYSDKALTTPYDFASEITDVTTVYAGWQIPTVTIGNYVKYRGIVKDGTKTADNYQMDNLSINGYPLTGTPIYTAVIEVTNADRNKIVLNDTTGVTDTYNNINETTGTGSYTIVFGDGVSVLDAQKVLRDVGIYVKTYTSNHTVQVTVYGDTK